MKPYYEKDGIVIYNGDCRDVLPTLGSFDMLLTDPPYGCKRPSQRTGRKPDIAGNETIDTSWLDLVSINEGGSAYVFTSWEVIEHWKAAMRCRWNLRSCIVWDKVLHGLADLATCWAPRHEFCLFAGVGRHELRNPRPIDVIQIQRTNETGHPYEKPLGLIQRIFAASDPKTVLDPFVGSGATLVAAKLTGRQAVGIEIDRTYCDMAVDRLRQGVLPLAI